MVGSVVVIEDVNGDITVKAECKEIGYKTTQERNKLGWAFAK